MDKKVYQPLLPDDKQIINVIEHFKSLGDNLSHYITASASTESNNTPSLVFSEDSHDYFATNDRSNSWIKFTFHQNKLILKEYSLRTHYTSSNGHIRGWKLEGSNNDSDWVMLSSFSSDTAFDSLGAEHSYQIEDNSTPFKYFKLTQTRSNTMDCNNLRLTRFRMYGILTSN